MKSLATALILGLGLVPFSLGVSAAQSVAKTELPTSIPEKVGFSSERLRRINDMIQRHIAADRIAGAVTLVARKGRVVYFEAHGLMDIGTKKPMQKDALFALASMTKPVTGVAVLMLMEEGKVHLTDPVSTFIPEFKAMKVAVHNDGGSEVRLVIHYRNDSAGFRYGCDAGARRINH